MSRSDEDGFIWLAVLVTALLVALAVAAAILLQLLLMEAVRVYRDNWSDEKRRRWLGYALMGVVSRRIS